MFAVRPVKVAPDVADVLVEIADPPVAALYKFSVVDPAPASGVNVTVKEVVVPLVAVTVGFAALDKVDAGDADEDVPAVYVPVPLSFIAATLNEYPVPFVSPVTVAEVAVLAV